MALTLARDALNIFWVDNNPIDFHTLSILHPCLCYAQAGKPALSWA
jgi:hypothetical protein